MTKAKLHSLAIRSSAIIGSASLATILIALVKVKILAVFLGPTGIGLIGLLQNVISTVSVVAGLGVSNVGTRQIAEAAGSGKSEDLAIARRALSYSTVFVCIFGFVAFLMLAYFIFPNIDGFKNSFSDNFIIAVAVLSTIAAASQISLLTGMRRIADIARTNVLSALLSAAIGIFAIWILGSAGIIILIVAVPLSSLIVGGFFSNKLPKPAKIQISQKELFSQLGKIGSLGFMFMVGGAISTLAPLAVRTLLNDSQGETALGEFQAAWQISMLYLGFVLTAMGTDYYPRLTASIKNRTQAVGMVNEQTEIAVLFSMPVLLIMLGAAPWIISLLYTNEFKNAADLLSLQILGDALKVVSWPLGYVLLATGDGKKFLLAEFLAFGSFVIVSWLLIPLYGLRASGIGFISMYVVYLPIVYYFAHLKIGFRWSNRNITQIIFLIVTCVFVKLIAVYDVFAGLLVSIGFSLVVLFYSTFRLLQLRPSGGLLGKLLSKLN